jgi:hypothetical protein
LKPTGIAQAASLDPAIAHAQPGQNVAAKSLDDGHAFPGFSQLVGLRPQGALRQPVQYLVDQRETLLDLAHANPDPGVDVALVQHRDLELQAVIGRIGQGPARIEGSAGGAADIASRGILFGQCGCEHAGIDGAVLQRRRVVVEFDQGRKAQADIAQHRLDQFCPVFAEVVGHAAGRNDIPQQSVTEGAIGCAQHALPQHAAMRVHQGEGGIIADRADVAEMVGKPLEFSDQCPQPNRAIGHDELQGGLSGPRKRIGIGDRAVARYAPGEFGGALQIGSDHQPLDALVGVSEPLLQPDHGLAAGGKAEMPGLDDPRMHRADRYLMQAVALRRQEAIGRCFR